jgi:uncharacterized membrane protein YdjX (TVP38/TMEM64 family)
MRRGQLAVKLLLLLLLVAGTIAVLFTPLRDELTLERAKELRDGLAATAWGPVVFVIAFGLLAVFPIPASVFVILAGAVWGWKLGTLYSVAGALIAASLSYWVARYLGAGVLDYFGPAGRTITGKLRGVSFKSFFLIRLIPGIPFVVFNYGAGAAGVRFPQFVLATAASVAPLMLVFTYSADALMAGTLAKEEAVKRLIIAAVLIATVVLLPSLFRRRAEKALHLIDDEEPTI